MTNDELITDIETEIDEIKLRIEKIRTGALPTASNPEWDVAIAQYNIALGALISARDALR
jgi:hypothetical protein